MMLILTAPISIAETFEQPESVAPVPESFVKVYLLSIGRLIRFWIMTGRQHEGRGYGYPPIYLDMEW